MTGLTISTNLVLPPEACTQTFAILAKRGVGKTYTANVMAEEMLEAGMHLVVADPVGVWWGLRSSADGKHAGHSIVVFGGDHADLPLQSTSGQVIADLIIQERIPAVLDLSLFRKGEQTRFMTDFCERLYQKNRNPLHFMMDEADAYAPQRPQPGEQRLLGAVEDIIRRGRARGLGATLITQRAAVLNKNVLTQIEVLVALRTIAPQDRAAVDAWIQVHGTAEQRKELMESLPSLPIGTAWFWSPGWLDMFKRVKVRQRRTFDSSATPKMGQQVIAPKALAPVDLEKIQARIAA
ncbi:MAG TPA: helicase HerA-like domain-containing protein, partial [Thiobacillus sp.]